MQHPVAFFFWIYFLFCKSPLGSMAVELDFWIDLEGLAWCLICIMIYSTCMRWFSSAVNLQHRRVEGPSAHTVILGRRLLADEIASPRG